VEGVNNSNLRGSGNNNEKNYNKFFMLYFSGTPHSYFLILNINKLKPSISDTTKKPLTSRATKLMHISN